MSFELCMGTEVLYLDVGWFVCCVSKFYWFISNMQIKTMLKVEIHGKICVNSL